MNNFTKGKFIVFEGADGCGKSTQVSMLKEYLVKNNVKCITTIEPGGTKIGKQIRNILLDNKNSEMFSMTEALLYAASRTQLVDEVIIPALQKGFTVISDRFIDSSVVYQGLARGLDIKQIETINQYVIDCLKPDVIIFIDITDDVGLERKRKQKSLDRIESEGVEFQRKVINGYRDILKERSDVIRIDGDMSEIDVHSAIKSALGFCL